ncbi:hypothetical protein ACI6QG_00570 [Roseococcus sp. DSY-14]|uniref:hypothetical protein n=1 Tax=Roseococcus sp. DSY-14 TaxID=3369650 RepID=UPI00387AC04F
MTALALGAALLLLMVALLYGFANARPAAVKQGLGWGLGLVGGGVALLLLLSGRGAQAAWALLMFGPALWQAARGWWARRRFARPAEGGGEASGVETALLEMRLDLETGAMTGRVRAGRLAGRELSALSLPELRALLEDAARDDPESVPLLEAWLDRAHPDWRVEGPAPPPAAGGPMTAAEALAVLGLAEGATRDEVRAAHRRLMQAAHPDRGGSDWLAARVNQARDVLLG